MKIRSTFKLGAITAVLSLLCPAMALSNLSVVLYDNFDDGNYNGWTVTDVTGSPDVRAPEIVLSPEGYAVRGTGSGYHPDWGNFLWHPVDLQNSTGLCIEMRARSGPQLPNEADVYLQSGSQDRYVGLVYGEGNRRADWRRYKDGQQDTFFYSVGDRAYEWHTYAWTRDTAGWWSLSIDGITEAPSYRQDLSITSFDSVELLMHRDQSEIEWVRVSAEVVPVPGAVLLGAIGLGFANCLLRRGSAA